MADLSLSAHHNPPAIRGAALAPKLNWLRGCQSTSTYQNVLARTSKYQNVLASTSKYQQVLPGNCRILRPPHPSLGSSSSLSSSSSSSSTSPPSSSSSSPSKNQLLAAHVGCATKTKASPSNISTEATTTTMTKTTMAITTSTRNRKISILTETRHVQNRMQIENKNAFPQWEPKLDREMKSRRRAKQRRREGNNSLLLNVDIEIAFYINLLKNANVFILSDHGKK